jgi:Protein of unknown function (DUF732)
VTTHRTVPAVLLALAVTGLTACSAQPPGHSAASSQVEREDQFWSALQTRTRLVSRGYVDPAAAKAGAIEYGKWICGKLATGTDKNLFIPHGVAPDNATREQFTVQVNTATEFLCPDQSKAD